MKEKIKQEIQEYARMLIVVFVTVFLINHMVIINAKIPSESMETTIMKGDHIFGNRLAYLFFEPERFDVVIFRFPDDESKLYIKRIIGLPGETVTIKDGKVYINSSTMPLDDSFTREPMKEAEGTYQVPKGCYFMMGDNRNNSSDSRRWTNKYVSKEKILGKATLRYYPLNKIGFVK